MLPTPSPALDTRPTPYQNQQRQPGRLYATACGLVLATSGYPLYLATVVFAEDCGLQPDIPQVDRYGVLAEALAITVWLIAAVLRRATGPRRRAQHLAAVAVGGTTVGFAWPTDAGIPSPTLASLAIAAASVWLVAEVCLAHGIDLVSLGLRGSPAAVGRRGLGWGLAILAIAACDMGGTTTASIIKYLSPHAAGVPEESQDQMLALTSRWQVIAQVTASTVVEDIVMVAAVCALLSAAGRRRWQMYTLVCVLEVALHAYLGIPAIGMALYAAGRARLFLEHRRVLPLVAGHAVYDLVLSPGVILPLSWFPMIESGLRPAYYLAGALYAVIWLTGPSSRREAGQS